MDKKSILVTGATGYVGGRLVPLLLELGHDVSVLVRDAERVAWRDWFSQVTVIEADLLASDASWGEVTGLADHYDVAYYLVHSINSGEGFIEREKKMVSQFNKVFSQLDHVIYLGGHFPSEGEVSEHLASRALTGELLAENYQCTQFRAGPVIGSGSASFEMLRYLTERLPVMVAPKWVMNYVQPVAIRNVLEYLVAALDVGPVGVVDIGGERMKFVDMMLRYGDVRGLKRLVIPLPVLTPGLAAHWVGFVTPISNDLAVPIIKSVISSVVADTAMAEKYFPQVVPMPFERAVKLALEKSEQKMIETRWSGAMGNRKTTELHDSQGMIKEIRSIYADVQPEHAYAAFTTLGGEEGWLAWNWAWVIRGRFDALIGGPGLRRGRRHPSEIAVGDAVDFWRVEKVIPQRELLLRAEMKVPGPAWLQFKVEPEGDGCRIFQTAYFEPIGLAGVLYWYALYPVHRLIFNAMISALAARAESFASGEKSI
ncbi:SDR family oxidoreductase [Persicirhabdus sediminis]|uniref:SDR family oxidoreductase n=1 Tax=Persicirhabdus sediminis TaxID=454144 RepID=A0A8J7MAN9_9BACT|nr:SDR family oxidoreductase [Persicirhabdus sediminis]MBK1789642.1 SDR family oxidoreductase [Persicirhabdus sediminis]